MHRAEFKVDEPTDALPMPQPTPEEVALAQERMAAVERLRVQANARDLMASDRRKGERRGSN